MCAPACTHAASAAAIADHIAAVTADSSPTRVCVHNPARHRVIRADLTGTGPPAGSGPLVGATNPMLARAPPSWLSLLTLADSDEGGERGSTTAAQPPSLRAGGFANLSYLLGFGGSGDNEGGAVESTSAHWTSGVEAFVQPDEAVLQRLRTSGAHCDGSADIEALLGEHFEQLTASFLQPLSALTARHACP